jgi:thiosulfate reductase cytochrome b subunit
MAEKLYLYPKWLRLWHALNALFILILIVTGVSMQFASLKYDFIRFDRAVSFHNIAGMLLTANYLLFFLGNVLTPNGKYYKMTIKGLFNKLKTQFLYYTVGIFRHEKQPFPVSKDRKFNPLQQFTYVVAMYIMVPIVVLTGWALLYPEMVLAKIMGSSGLKINDFVHVILGFLLSFFMFVHIYFCTIGATFVSNFKSMINGYHQSH